jgi:hypothetical protein
MEFTIYRDLASIAFVRCTCPILGTDINAEGTGFSVARAIAKCRSEFIESQFQLSHPLRARMLGIAAHPDSKNSEINAWNETLETLVLEQLASSGTFHGFSVSLFDTKLCLGRVADRFVALALFTHRGVPTATQAVSKNPLRSLLKAWSEVRNLRLYNPDPKILPSYTKANRLLSSSQLSNIIIKPTFRKNPVKNRGLRKFQHQDRKHFITYFTKEIDT